VVGSRSATPSGRARALTVLARCRPEAAAPLIPDLFGDGQPEAVRSAAARALGEVGSPELAAPLLRDWGALPTRNGREVISALTGSIPLARCLVVAIEDDTIGLPDLTPSDRDALRRIADLALRGRVEALLARSTPSNRAAVIGKFRGALDLE